MEFNPLTPTSRTLLSDEDVVVVDDVAEASCGKIKETVDSANIFVCTRNFQNDTMFALDTSHVTQQLVYLTDVERRQL